MTTLSTILKELAAEDRLVRTADGSAPTSASIAARARELEEKLEAGEELQWRDLHDLVLRITLRRIATAKTVSEQESAMRMLHVLYTRTPTPHNKRTGSAAPKNPRGPQKNPRKPSPPIRAVLNIDDDNEEIEEHDGIEVPEG